VPQPHLPTLRLCWERVCVEAYGQVSREAVEGADAVSVYTSFRPLYGRRKEDVLKILVLYYRNPGGGLTASAHTTVLGTPEPLTSRVVQYLEARGFKRASEGYLAFEGHLPRELFRELCRALGLEANIISLKRSRSMGWRAFAEAIHGGLYDRVEIRPPEILLA